MSGRPLRIFVALYPPEEARRAMVESLKTISPPPDPRHRVVPVDQVHMTVQFVGETAEREVEEVVESTRRSVAGLGAFELTPRRLITLPERGPVRLIAMETDAPASLLEMQRRLAVRLARSARAKVGDRFLPHLTLCRFGAEARATRISQGVKLPPFEVRSVLVMRSILKPQGAEHVPVAEAALT